MLYFSSLLKTNDIYKPAGERLFAALNAHGIQYKLHENTGDIWIRDFMPVKTKTDKYISFRYEPSYLKDYPKLLNDFRKKIAPSLSLENIVYSDINLDGGNVVFSPSREKAVISDRMFMENWEYSSAELMQKLEQLLEAKVVIIPSLRSDMTGHADGMVRFIDENTVVGNRTGYRYGLEMQIKLTLRNQGIEVYDFPYFESKGDSAIGCYLNFLETEQHLFCLCSALIWIGKPLKQQKIFSIKQSSRLISMKSPRTVACLIASVGRISYGRKAAGKLLILIGHAIIAVGNMTVFWMRIRILQLIKQPYRNIGMGKINENNENESHIEILNKRRKAKC